MFLHHSWSLPFHLPAALRSTGITPLHRYYGPLRLPRGTLLPVIVSRPELAAALRRSRPDGSLMFPTGPSARAAPFHPGEPRRCTRKPLPGEFWLRHIWLLGRSRVSCNEAVSGSLSAAARTCGRVELHGKGHPLGRVDVPPRSVSSSRDKHLAACWVGWTFHDVPEARRHRGKSEKCK